ncbi:MAG: metallopeptidase TldD-related protein [Sphingomicrobium sp.]
MLHPDAASAAISSLVDRARRAGADAADAIYVGNLSSSVQVRDGATEDVSRSESEAVGLRLFVGQRSASASTSDLSDDALETLAQRVTAMAREAPEDPYAGLAPAELLASAPFPDLDGWDPAEPGPAELKERALAAEAAAMSVPGATKSNGCGAGVSAATVSIATSEGFAGGYRLSGHSCSAGVIAGEGATMQRDHAWHSSRHLGDLEAPEDIGRKAAKRAVSRVGSTKIVPGAMPILFEPRVASSLLGHLAGAISGTSIARKSSFLLEALGERIFAPGIMILDDPLRPRGLRSRAFDGEGLPVRPMAIVDDGMLTTWFAESASARQLGIAPTGHASRGIGGSPSAGPSNFSLGTGKRSVAAMLAEVGRAIIVTELIGQGVNGVTGDYSRGAAGFLVENGEIVGPVSEITIASNLKQMFASLEPADDLEYRTGVDSPSVLIPEMTVGSA